MLLASSELAFHGSRLRSTLVLERTFRILVLHRERLVFDSRFMPPLDGPAGATLYIVLDGAIHVEASPALRGPTIYMLSDDEFERASPAATKFRSWGAPSVTIEVRFAAPDVRAPIGIAAGPVSCSSATWSACHELASAAIGAGLGTETIAAFVGGLARDGVVDAAVLEFIQAPDSDPFARLWSGLRPLYESSSASTSIGDIKRATGFSTRQLGRLTSELADTFRLGAGFRDTVKVVRLRLAILLLSAPDATATEVAKLVGYKSLDAMGRAFRDARLPAPSLVQDAIRYRD